MSYTLYFPNTKDAEPHKGLLDEDDVYAAVKSEVTQSVSDMGSDGYDLDWHDTFPQGYDEDAYNALSEDEQLVATGKAHERGVNNVVAIHAVSIFESLWRLHKDDKANTIDKLPDGTVIALKEEDD